MADITSMNEQELRKTVSDQSDAILRIIHHLVEKDNEISRLKENLEAQETIAEIQKIALEDAKVFHLFDSARYVLEGVAVRTKKGNWIPYKPSWAAPACNSRQIVKLNNGWVCCATYYYNKNHLEKDACWQWKNDSGEWIDQDAVVYWKGLEE